MKWEGEGTLFYHKSLDSNLVPPPALGQVQPS